MPIYYVKRSHEAILELGENVLVWFSDSTFEGCNNALLLAGGDLLLLKTVRRISQDELRELSEEYLKWREVFGTGQIADELRAALNQSRKVNNWLT
jgi:hypothetical protein